MSKPTQAHDARTCPHCGKEFTPRNKAQRYCTNRKDGPGSCQKMAERERERHRGRNRRKVPMLCHHCGVEFMGEKRKRIKGSRERYYCSHRCYSDYRSWGFRKHFATRLNWRHCRDCDNQFISKNGHKRCARCRRPSQHPRFVSGACLECGKHFVGTWHPLWPARFCCDECATRAGRRARRKQIGHTGTHRQRARKLGLAYEWVNRRKVFERDKYRCGLCGCKTDPQAEPCSPRYPTLDHILPMALGGGHTYSNVQCACFECNWIKADNPPNDPQQMQLGLYLVPSRILT